ncbi:MAG: hypothetical protein K2X77_10240, partial [Candidatus Obscuribacterales bacterium]|nr:hypothetical protein [Candidatus Obscuribacterales bacterium]
GTETERQQGDQQVQAGTETERQQGDLRAQAGTETERQQGDQQVQAGTETERQQGDQQVQAGTETERQQGDQRDQQPEQQPEQRPEQQQPDHQQVDGPDESTHQQQQEEADPRQSNADKQNAESQAQSHEIEHQSNEDDRQSDDQTPQGDDQSPNSTDQSPEFEQHETPHQSDNDSNDRLPDVDPGGLEGTNQDSPQTQTHETEHDQHTQDSNDTLPDVDPGGLEGQVPNHQEENRESNDGDQGPFEQTTDQNGSTQITDDAPHENTGEGPVHGSDGVGEANQNGNASNEAGTHEGGPNNSNTTPELSQTGGATNSHSADQEVSASSRNESNNGERAESLERSSTENGDSQSVPQATRGMEPVSQERQAEASARAEGADTLGKPAARDAESAQSPLRDAPAGDSMPDNKSIAVNGELKAADKPVETAASRDIPAPSNPQPEAESSTSRDSISSTFFGRESNTVANQADGDDAPSPATKEKEAKSEESRQSAHSNPGFSQPGFVNPGVTNPAAPQSRADAQLASMPIRPLTSGFLEKAGLERNSLNAMALNSKAFQTKFAGEQSKTGKDGKGLPGDRKSLENGMKGLDARFDPRFGGVGKIEGKAARILKRRLGMSGEKRYLTGIEIALAAAITAAAIAKRRNGVSDEQAAGEIAEQQLAQLLGDLRTDEKNKNAKDSGMYRNSVNHFKRPTHLVQPNESLTSIAEDYFADTDIAWLIADINAGLINEHFEDGKRIVELRSRVEIELPLPSEITEFFAKKQKNHKGDLIVTIINDTEIDTELLNSFLGTVVGISNHSAPPIDEPVALTSLIGKAKIASAVSGTPVSMNAVLDSGENLNTFVSGLQFPNVVVQQD